MTVIDSHSIFGRVVCKSSPRSRCLVAVSNTLYSSDPRVSPSLRSTAGKDAASLKPRPPSDGQSADWSIPSGRGAPPLAERLRAGPGCKCGGPLLKAGRCVRGRPLLRRTEAQAHAGGEQAASRRRAARGDALVRGQARKSKRLLTRLDPEEDCRLLRGARTLRDSLEAIPVRGACFFFLFAFFFWWKTCFGHPCVPGRGGAFFCCLSLLLLLFCWRTDSKRSG